MLYQVRGKGKAGQTFNQLVNGRLTRRILHQPVLDKNAPMTGMESNGRMECRRRAVHDAVHDEAALNAGKRVFVWGRNLLERTL
jgi:hypothetical protein